MGRQLILNDNILLGMSRRAVVKQTFPFFNRFGRANSPQNCNRCNKNNPQKANLQEARSWVLSLRGTRLQTFKKLLGSDVDTIVVYYRVKGDRKVQKQIL